MIEKFLQDIQSYWNDTVEKYQDVHDENAQLHAELETLKEENIQLQSELQTLKQELESVAKQLHDTRIELADIRHHNLDIFRQKRRWFLF